MSRYAFCDTVTLELVFLFSPSYLDLSTDMGFMVTAYLSILSSFTTKRGSGRIGTVLGAYSSLLVRFSVSVSRHTLRDLEMPDVYQ
jgi:hypothetical protein